WINTSAQSHHNAQGAGTLGHYSNSRVERNSSRRSESAQTRYNPPACVQQRRRTLPSRLRAWNSIPPGATRAWRGMTPKAIPTGRRYVTNSTRKGVKKSVVTPFWSYTRGGVGSGYDSQVNVLNDLASV